MPRILPGWHTAATRLRLDITRPDFLRVRGPFFSAGKDDQEVAAERRDLASNRMARPVLMCTVADHAMRAGRRRDAGMTNISPRAQNTF